MFTERLSFCFYNSVFDGDQKKLLYLGFMFVIQ